MKYITVPFIDLKQRYEVERVEILACIDKVLSKGHLILTEEVDEFERQVAKYIGVKHVIGLNSGTDALMMALWSNGVKKGDEVITTPISFIATTAAIIHVGATPIYVDVCADQNIDVSKIESAITPKTKAIMPVHWGGRLANMPEIMKVASKHGLIVIEDAAQSMGSYLGNQHGGSFGHAAAYSAHPLKNLNALGDAGFLSTNDDEVAKKVRLYRNHGIESRDNCILYGVNSRLDSLNAEVLKLRLNKLVDIIKIRRSNVRLYRELIKTNKIFIPPENEGEKHSYVVFNVQAKSRDELKVYLESKSIETLVYYGKALHLQPAAKNLGYKVGDFPVAERQCEEVIALPHHQFITEEQIAYVSHHINQFYELKND